MKYIDGIWKINIFRSLLIQYNLDIFHFFFREELFYEITFKVWYHSQIIFS